MSNFDWNCRQLPNAVESNAWLSSIFGVSTNGMQIPANGMRMRANVCIKYECMSMYAPNVQMASRKYYINVNQHFHFI